MALSLERLQPVAFTLGRAWPFLLPLWATWSAHDKAPWIAMWMLALSWFFAFKLCTLLNHAATSADVTARGAMSYLFLWPGMDAPAFFATSPESHRMRATHWALAGGNLLLGVAIFWGLARWMARVHDLLAGWIGLVGIALMLHFGIAHVAALAWRRQGVPVQPLMNWPPAARSVSDFWSNRWNLAFRDLAQLLVFRPLMRRCGAAGATFAVFAVSGLIHDAVISWSARGGYGWPTLYFLIQGSAILLEKSPLGRRRRLGRGWSGRLFAWLVVVPSAYMLFHPPFMRTVVLPMMQAAGAL
jgi:alginate O-acetyltransferase complex protein AlgI